ncbi:MAG: hypothetical protein SGI72_11340 [Planctomycetota bacterium]|nr:hypothetical protein [Planctomycetota bacterium]
MSADPNDRGDAAAPKKSFGNMGPDHWSRAREGENEEAIAYYRERSKAPGVAEGGAERNHYCMRCDGVIPFDLTLTHCPHCKAPIEVGIKRYFNWVEMNEPPKSDVTALLVFGAGVGALIVLVGLGLWWWSK